MTRMGNYHTALDFGLFNTAKQQTYVVASFAFVQNLTEHFDTGNDRLLVFAQAQN